MSNRWRDKLLQIRGTEHRELADIFAPLEDEPVGLSITARIQFLSDGTQITAWISRAKMVSTRGGLLNSTS